MSLESVFANPPPLVGTSENLQQTKRLDSKDVLNDNAETKNDEKEDGEIEDGEIEDDEYADLDESHVADGTVGSHPDTQDPVQKQQSVDKMSDNEENGADDDKTRKKRKKKLKRKKEKEKRKEKEKYKKKKQYVDHDKVVDDQLTASWPPGGNRVQNHYRSPYGSPNYGNGYRSPHYTRSPPGPYDSPGYDSPPGPYDSPDEYDEYDDMEPAHKRSLIAMVGDDDMMVDSSVGAMERDGMFQPKMRSKTKGGMAVSSRKKMEKRKRYMEMKRSMESKRIREQEKSICKFYMEGKCSKGDDCAYSHDFIPPKKPEVCKFYLSNACVKGSRCVYMHKEFPCKFFHGPTNHCSNGESCKFSHAELTLETEAIVDRLLASDEAGFDIVGALEKSAEKSKKPSLLGSPPRHIKEQAEKVREQKKTIPSLLDLDVKPVPEAMGPARPMKPGFYKDTTASPQGHASNRKLKMLSPTNNSLLGLPPAPVVRPAVNPGVGPVMGAGIPKTFYNNFYAQQQAEDQMAVEELVAMPTEQAVTFTIPPNLAPKQRELFLRIHQQQMKRNDSDHLAQNTEKGDEDENWYSSDEEEQSGAKLSDVLKNISQVPISTFVPPQPVIQQPPLHVIPAVAPAVPTADSSINIAKILSVIKNQNTDGQPSPGSVMQTNLLQSLIGNGTPTVNQPPIHQSTPKETSPRPFDPRKSSDPRKKVADPRRARNSPQSYQSDQVDEEMDQPEVQSNGIQSTVSTGATKTHKNQTEEDAAKKAIESIVLGKSIDRDKTYKVHRLDKIPKLDYNVALMRKDTRLKNDPRLQKQLKRQELTISCTDGKTGENTKTTDSHVIKVNNNTDSHMIKVNNNTSELSKEIDAAKISRRRSSEKSNPESQSVDNPSSSSTSVNTIKTEAPPMPDALKNPLPSPPHMVQQPGNEEKKIDANPWRIPKTNRAPERLTLNHRTDPRFKIKPKKRTESMDKDDAGSGSQSCEDFDAIKVKTDYSSPLENVHSSENNDVSYSNYNRLPAVPPAINPKQEMKPTHTNLINETKPNVVTVEPDLPAFTDPMYDEFVDDDSGQDSPTNDLMIDEMYDPSKETLKDVFKTIDPTASPFC